MTESLDYLFAVYTIIFVVIFFYLMFLWRRQARLDAALRTIEARLKETRDELSSRLPQSRSAS